MNEDEQQEILDRLSEVQTQLRKLEDDYDILSRFFIAYCALPEGSVPRIGVTPTEAYLHLTVNGTNELRERMEKFISFAQQFINRGDAP